MSLGSLIRDGRTAKRMTLRKLAEILGVSVPYLSDVEHDRRSVSLDRLAQVSETLGIPLAELEAHGGVSRHLITWLRKNPDILVMLHEARRTGQHLMLIPVQRRRVADHEVDDDTMNRRIGGITQEDIRRGLR